MGAHHGDRRSLQTPFHHACNTPAFSTYERSNPMHGRTSRPLAHPILQSTGTLQVTQHIRNDKRRSQPTGPTRPACHGHGRPPASAKARTPWAAVSPGNPLTITSTPCPLHAGSATAAATALGTRATNDREMDGVYDWLTELEAVRDAELVYDRVFVDDGVYERDFDSVAAGKRRMRHTR